MAAWLCWMLMKKEPKPKGSFWRPLTTQVTTCRNRPKVAHAHAGYPGAGPAGRPAATQAPRLEELLHSTEVADFIKATSPSGDVIPGS